VFTGALEQKLLRTAEWREFAYGVSGDDDTGRQTAVARLTELVSRFQEYVGRMQPQALAEEMVASFCERPHRSSFGSSRS